MDLDPAQVRALQAAVSEGTFEAAARALQLTPSAVSQRIKALENRVGRVLLTRTKPVRVTESGQAVLRFARQLDALGADVARQLGGAEPGAPTLIPIAINADSLATWVLPALAQAGPSTCFEILRADEQHTQELLRAGTVMAAITASPEAVPGSRTTRLGAMRYRPMATPAFVRRWFDDGAPTTRALAVAPMIAFDRVDSLQDRYLRRRSRQPLQPPRHYVPGSVEMQNAILLGLGWGLLPDLQAEQFECRGELVALEPKGAIDVALFWMQWRLNSPALDEVSALVHAYAAQNLR